MRAMVVMGVSGCGKSTVAAALCERIGARLVEGDAFHPPANIRKMHAGIPLDDADRQGWLQRLADELRLARGDSSPTVLTCSALKRRYRDVLRAAEPGLGFVFLELSMAEATARVAQRSGHFMPATLVESQFRDLESPRDEAGVFTVHAMETLPAIVDAVEAWWRRANGGSARA